MLIDVPWPVYLTWPGYKTILQTYTYMYLVWPGCFPRESILHSLIFKRFLVKLRFAWTGGEKKKKKGVRLFLAGNVVSTEYVC